MRPARFHGFKLVLAQLLFLASQCTFLNVEYLCSREIFGLLFENCHGKVSLMYVVGLLSHSCANVLQGIQKLDLSHFSWKSEFIFLIEILCRRPYLQVFKMSFSLAVHDIMRPVTMQPFVAELDTV